MNHDCKDHAHDEPERGQSERSAAEQQQRVVSCEELKIIADMTVKLTELRQAQCGHLAIENFSPNLFASMLGAVYMHKNGSIYISGDVDFDLKYIVKDYS